MKELKDLTSIDYNKMMELNSYFETIYLILKNSHQELLKIIENGDCFDSEKKDQLFSYIKEYEAKIIELKSDIFSIDAENKKIQSCLSETRLLKKKRLTKLESNMSKRMEEIDPLDLPF